MVSALHTMLCFVAFKEGEGKGQFSSHLRENVGGLEAFFQGKANCQEEIDRTQLEVRSLIPLPNSL